MEEKKSSIKNYNNSRKSDLIKENLDEEINLDEILAELEGELNEGKEDIDEDARTDAEEEG